MLTSTKIVKITKFSFASDRLSIFKCSHKFGHIFFLERINVKILTFGVDQNETNLPNPFVFILVYLTKVEYGVPMTKSVDW